MYNYSFKTTYINKEEKLQDPQYRNDLLTAFYLQSYNHKCIMNEIDNLYNKFKDNKQISIILNNIIKKSSFFPNHNLVGKLSKSHAFILLFSFQNFCYFHECLCYLLQNKSIDENYFNMFISFIQKK